MKLLIEFINNKFRVDASYFIRGGFWLFVAQGATVLFSLLTSYYLANNLNESVYGNYRYILGLAMLLGVFSLTGAGQAINQAASKGYEWFYIRAVKKVLSFGLIITFLAFGASAYYYLQGNELLSFGALLIALLHPISQVFGCTISYLHGTRNYQTSSFVQAIKSIFIAATLLATLYFTNSVWVLLSSYFISQALAAIITFLVLQPGKDENPPEHDVEQKYLKYAKHTSLRSMVDGFASRLDAILVFQQIGAIELATYSIASLLPDQIRGSFKGLQTLLVPKYVLRAEEKNFYSNIVKRALQLSLPLLAISIGTIIGIPLFYSALFPVYEDSIIYAQLLSLAFPAAVYHIPLAALQTKHAEKSLYIYNISASFFQVTLLLLGLVLFGLIGVVAAKVLTQYFRTILLFILLRNVRT